MSSVRPSPASVLRGRRRSTTRTPDPPRRISGSGLLRAAGLLLVAYLALTAIWAGIGLLLTGPLADSGVTALDHTVTGSLVDHRTPVLDRWSAVGSLLAETMVKVVATAVVALAMFVLWRSWREPFLVCGALILEAAVFITVTVIVGRERPDVAQLDEVAVGTSFPSGHAAAAAAYSAIAVVIFERTRNVWVRSVTVLLAVAVPVIVGLSRMYRGVHYPTDVVGGLLLGVTCVIVVYVITERCFQRPPPRPGEEAPASRAPRST